MERWETFKRFVAQKTFYSCSFLLNDWSMWGQKEHRNIRFFHSAHPVPSVEARRSQTDLKTNYLHLIKAKILTL